MNLLLRMCTLDAAKIRRPLFYGETNDIVVFGKMLNIFWYKCGELHLKDDSTVLSEYLTMDVILALLRMEQAFLMQSGISPDNMQKVSGL